METYDRIQKLKEQIEVLELIERAEAKIDDLEFANLMNDIPRLYSYRLERIAVQKRYIKMLEYKLTKMQHDFSNSNE